MAGQYEEAITIQEAIERINNNDFLLPAIQRKFVWSSHQICILFDSLMRDFPINSFMMWEVKERDIKKSYKFYQFLKGYCKRFNEENPELITKGSFKDFKAVIDGQQRLTSLYIGLCSTYAYKQPRVHWPTSQDDNKLPPRKLYLDLMSAENREDDEALMQYRFKFLTDHQYNSSIQSKEKKQHWLCIQEVLDFPDVSGSTEEEIAKNVMSDVVMPFIELHELSNNEFAISSLAQLYHVIRRKPVIHYFNETSQKIDHVLDVFIRTNSGGTKLDFADLLMSIAVANWDGDFRKEVDSLVKVIHQSDEMGFYLERDWVLKVCLMLIGSDVRFKVKNFKAEQVELIQSQWEDIKACIKATLKLIRRFGINPQSLTSKNAVIPICYYLYEKKLGEPRLYLTINNLAKVPEQRQAISRWLCMVLLKGIFGGQADTILAGMRTVLKNNLDKPVFPLDQIVEEYKGTNKELRFDAEYIDKLLYIQYGDGRCRALLHLLFPEKSLTEVFHIDHLHPRSAFDKKALQEHEFLSTNEDLKAFYIDPAHWNSMPNLHLLNGSQNISKNAQPLSTWIEESEASTVTKQSLLLDDTDSLEFEDFKSFYEQRRAALKRRLMDKVFMTDVLTVNDVEDDHDEEVVEEAGVLA